MELISSAGAAEMAKTKGGVDKSQVIKKNRSK
jgi:hypothetical protein